MIGETTGTDAAPVGDPDRIDAYEIIRVLGRNETGAVYLGARTRGDFDHQVAIKLLKSGVLSEWLIERFQRERQILARLSHPNIAQLFDGGETAAGEPYLVMEYVDGVALPAWVAEHHPVRDARLALFLQICAAVSFAHQNLIVHRDLTPLNVLVTRSARPKLINFGVSRTADEDIATAGPADRAATLGDIRSLGEILEGLVGKDSDADLSAIIDKACADDLGKRHLSADALANDVMRYRAGFPVPARGRGRGYVFGKFVNRHRPGVGAAVLGVVLLVVALVLTLQAYSRAEAARLAEAARFEDVRSLANFMLFDLNDRLERVVGNTATRVELADRAQRYLAELARSPRTSDQLKLEAAQGFIKLARIRGVPTEPNFGQREEARADLAAAVRLLRSIENGMIDVAPNLARAYALLAMIQLHGDQELATSGRTVGLAVAALAASPPRQRDAAWHLARGDVRKAQIELDSIGGQTNDLIRLANLLDRETRHWPVSIRNSRAAALDRANAAMYRAVHLFRAEPDGDSVPAFLEAERRFRALDAARRNEPIVLYLLTWTEYIAISAAESARRPRDVTYFLTAARENIERLLAIEANDRSLRNLEINIMQAASQILSDRREFAQAIALQRNALVRFNALVTPNNHNFAGQALSHIILGGIAREASERELACGSWQQARTLFADAARAGESPGYYDHFRPGLLENLRLCAAGAPVSRFAALE